MMPRRTTEQLNFDLMKHGWAFCNAHMLAGKIEALESLSKYLAKDDKLHAELTHIKVVKEQMG